MSEARERACSIGLRCGLVKDADCCDVEEVEDLAHALGVAQGA
jgi:hypothetical protein